MIKTPFRKTIFVLVICSLFCMDIVWCQPYQRFFDDAPMRSKNVRLTVLYPSLGDLKALVQLREKGLIYLENLIVIGLYHENQLTNFENTIHFAQENGHQWIKFHELKRDLDPERLFQKNALSKELHKIFLYSDGLLLFGGADIPPSVYQEKTSLLTEITTPFRSYLDTMVVFHLLGGWQDESFHPYCEAYPEFPILGLCLGCQSLNVGTGGTLYQDIPSEIYEKKHIEDIIAMTPENWHQNPYSKIYRREFRSSNMHRIKLTEDGKFVKEWEFRKDDEPFIYSAHHQSIRKLGKGIKVVATSLDDKVIEAIEHATYPNVLGVQFHPEARSLWDTDKKSRLTPEDQEGTSLFPILEKNPPSLAFHKKIWSWFSQKLQESYKRRMKQSN
jgi:putative glutamine amidotransferase